MLTNETICPVAGCGHSPFPISADFERRARRTHETFYCPAGHSQYFAGKSREEELKDEIARLKRVVENRDNFINQLNQEIRESRATCAWTGCEFAGFSRTGLRAHMRAAHGMPTVAEVAAAEEAKITEMLAVAS